MPNSAYTSFVSSPKAAQKIWSNVLVCTCICSSRSSCNPLTRSVWAWDPRIRSGLIHLNPPVVHVMHTFSRRLHEFCSSLRPAVAALSGPITILGSGVVRPISRMYNDSKFGLWGILLGLRKQPSHVFAR